MRLTLKPISSTKVLATSHGEVKIDETLNFKSGLPVKGGLLCQEIFGPVKNYACECGKYDGKKYQGHTCEKCKVTVTTSRSRTERMGHIDLQIPVLNPICRKAVQDIFGVTKETLDLFLRSRLHAVFSPRADGNLVLVDGRVGSLHFVEDDSPLLESLNDSEYTKSSLALYMIIMSLNLSETLKVNRSRRLHKYAEVNFDLKDLFLRHLPVSPAAYRPVMKMGDYYSADSKNELYLRIVRRAIRIKTLKQYNAEKTLLQAEGDMMFKAIKQLQMGGARDGKGNDLPGIIGKLKSKGGLLRGNILGKRVDYSGRSVITSGGDRVEIDQIGLPRKMAYILFKPFILNYLIENYVEDYSDALDVYNRKTPVALKSMEMVARSRKVLMNRAPSLHRYSVMAFRVKLHDGKAIFVHPMVCSPFNADFDGDTVAIHVPLSDNAMAECDKYMTPQSNLLASLDGEPLINLSHEMIIGLSAMTRIKDTGKKFDVLSSMDTLEYLHTTPDPNTGKPYLHIADKIYFRESGVTKETCYGRLILEDIFKTKKLPSDFTKKTIRALVSDAYDTLGAEPCMRALDKASQIAFKYATLAGFSVGKDDITVPSTKPAKVAAAEAQQAQNWLEFNESAKTEADKNRRFENNVRLWNDVFEGLHHDWMKEAGPDNPVVLMYTTGARVSKLQVNQIGVAKGLVSDAGNRIIEQPMVNSFKEGLTMYEYFRSCSGSRKSMADKKNLTPKSGYLTRRMITASRDLMVTQEECKCTKGLWRTRKSSAGRYTLDGDLIEKNDDQSLVQVRSPIHCTAERGICVKCFGIDPATRNIVRVGSNVGAIAAHSLTESTTQMTMRTFHTSGAVKLSESPLVIRAGQDGKVAITASDADRFIKIRIYPSMDDWDTPLNAAITYTVDGKHAKILVEDGASVKKGDPISVYVANNLQADDVSGSLPKIESLYEGRIPKESPRAILAKAAGTIELATKDDGIVIYIDGVVQGTAKNTPVFVASGEKVEACQVLSYGNPDVVAFYRETGNIDNAYKVFENTAMSLYKAEGLSPKPIHLEMIFRAMSDLVKMEDDQYGLRSQGDQGYIELRGVTQVGSKYPSWLKSIGFGWVQQTIQDSVVNLRSTYDTPTERIMSGELIFQQD